MEYLTFRQNTDPIFSFILSLDFRTLFTIPFSHSNCFCYCIVVIFVVVVIKNKTLADNEIVSAAVFTIFI